MTEMACSGHKFSPVRVASHHGINRLERVDIPQVDAGHIGAGGRLQPGVDHGAELKTGAGPPGAHIFIVGLDQIQEPDRLGRDE